MVILTDVDAYIREMITNNVGKKFHQYIVN